MFVNIKLSKACLSKRIQSGEFLGNMIGKLGKETMMKFYLSLMKDILSKLA